MDGVNAEFGQWLISLGVGGVLAALIFVFYRKDMKQYTDNWSKITDQLIKVVTDNTASNAKLITLIEGLERNAMRKSDIELLIQERIRSVKE